MTFGSPVFLFAALPAVLLLTALIRRSWRVPFLLAASAFLYLWAEGRRIWILALALAWNGAFARLVATARDDAGRKRRLRLGIAGNVLLLVVFKYAGFLVDNLNAALGVFSVHPLSRPEIPLPLGISFLTFLAISYLVDTARGAAADRASFAAGSLYISFFPTMMAGPITPYREMAPQLGSPGNRRPDLHEGSRRFIVGLAKKTLIADTLAGIAGPVFAIPGADLTPPVAWLGIAAYTLQIYYDFSGYTDMAVGLGRMLGFRFMENFDFPYAASSIKDFWTRWHKSLTRWLRDYVFLPVAYKTSRAIPGPRWLGLRAEAWAYAAATAATMLLCGIWHGASWIFVLWGGYHGALLLLERFVWGRRLGRAWRPVRHVYAMALVMVGWVLFRNATLEGAMAMLKAMTGLQRGHPLLYPAGLFLDPKKIAALAAAVAFGGPWAAAARERLRRGRETAAGARPGLVDRGLAAAGFVWTAVLLLLSAMSLAGETFRPFIYSQF